MMTNHSISEYASNLIDLRRFRRAFQLHKSVADHQSSPTKNQKCLPICRHHRGVEQTAVWIERAQNVHTQPQKPTQTFARARRPPRAAFGFAMLHFQLSSEKWEFPFSPRAAAAKAAVVRHRLVCPPPGGQGRGAAVMAMF